MIYFLIGHRGTGKTAFARRQFPSTYLDLDFEIEKSTGESPTQILNGKGEIFFRQTERQVLEKLLAQRSTVGDVVIVLGAGFELDQFRWPERKTFERIWLRRATDSRGRIFTDRPRLEKQLTPLDEYQRRFEARDKVFQAYADWKLEIPEGDHLRIHSAAHAILRHKSETPSGILTIQAGDRQRADLFLQRFLNLSLLAFELRTDLLSKDDLQFWLSRIPAGRILWAERSDDRVVLPEKSATQFFDWDWAGEWGEPPRDVPVQTFSNHGVELPGKTMASVTQNLKWSPLIESWKDLRAGYRWQGEDPAKRSFLPRSSSGRWAWFRLLMKGRQRLNFVREAANVEAPDQPTLVEWFDHSPHHHFAAILGDPVEHSWTPGLQHDFFAAKKIPVLRIPVRENEWDEAFPFLAELGLIAAAVTSPLKIEALRSATSLTARGRDLGAVNTLKYLNGDWHGDNTDGAGLRAALIEHGLVHFAGPVQVWGGGGTLGPLRDLFPDAEFYSVRTQSLRNGGAPVLRPGSLFIWAAGPRDSEPQFAIQPEIVLDLNYREDSNARELALRLQARYISGEAMFRAQGAEQQNFWKDIP